MRKLQEITHEFPSRSTKQETGVLRRGRLKARGDPEGHWSWSPVVAVPRLCDSFCDGQSKAENQTALSHLEPPHLEMGKGQGPPCREWPRIRAWGAVCILFIFRDVTWASLPIL